MFSHIMLGSNDLERTKQFYDATMGAVGAKPGVFNPRGALVYMHGGGLLILTLPLNGEPASHANGGSVGFRMESPEQADAWHAAGCASGGTTCEDPPGWRDNALGKMYLAYLRDPDGNKLCAIHR